MGSTTVLVTGADGFIGRALVRSLREAGHDVTALGRADGDVADAATWASLPAVTHVFHLAGRAYVPDSWTDPAGFMHANVSGTTRALDYCRASGAHLVFTSVSLFGAPKRLPVREDDVITPSNPYALSKCLAEQACAFYAATWNVPTTVIRLFNVYGPGQREDYVIPLIVTQVRRREPIRVKTLSPRRDFIFLDDLLDALSRTMTSSGGYRLINIGSGTSHSVQDVIDAIQAAAGTRLPVESSEEDRRNEIPDVYADITRARDLLGWSPQVPFTEGIRRLMHEQ